MTTGMCKEKIVTPFAKGNSGTQMAPKEQEGQDQVYSAAQEGRIRLGQYVVVFQAQVVTVPQCDEKLIEENAAYRQITIWSDSQSAINVVGKP